MKTPFPKIIDSTMRREFAMCEKRCYYGSFRKLALSGGNIHLHFGGCFARGLECTRKAFYGEGLSLMDALAVGAEAIIKSWGDFPAPDIGNKSLDTCLVTLYEYFKQYPPMDDVIQPMVFNGKPAVEFTFAVPIDGMKHPETGEPLIYAGRFDMLGYYGNAAFIVDEKTAGSLGASWAKQFKLSSQMTGYVWAAKKYKFPVQGAIIRGIGILKNSITHQMVITPRPDWMIERWFEQLKRDINRMIVAWETGVWNYDIDHSCGSYGGCPFIPLCESPEPESWIGTYYEERNWNPLAKDD